MKAREPRKRMTYADIGKVYRERLGGPFFPVSQDPKPAEQWFCDLQSCTQYRDYDGTLKGSCSGYCCGF